MTAHTASDYERDIALIDVYLAPETPEAMRQRVVAALGIAARVVDGWQCVPKIPTLAMIEDGEIECADERTGLPVANVRSVYRAMLDAAAKAEKRK
jgi:hypothetical protein